MRIPVLRGRTFDATDEVNSPNAAVVSQSLVQKYWPNEDPIGQTIQFGNMDSDLRLLHIVGVVGDVHDNGLDAKIAPTIYANSLQRLPSSTWTVVARAQTEPSALVPAMREGVKSLDPRLPINFRTLDQVFSSSLDQQRFSLVIFGAFGAAALLLAAIGIYGGSSACFVDRGSRGLFDTGTKSDKSRSSGSAEIRIIDASRWRSIRGWCRKECCRSSRISLCNLRVLCVSVVTVFQITSTTETQRTRRLHREKLKLDVCRPNRRRSRVTPRRV